MSDGVLQADLLIQGVSLLIFLIAWKAQACVLRLADQSNSLCITFPSTWHNIVASLKLSLKLRTELKWWRN